MLFENIPQLTPWPTYRVNISWHMLAETLQDWGDGGTLQLDPAFQRAHVWSTTQQIRYVEYILRGGFSGKDIYFNQADWQRINRKEPLYLVDGKQRLEAVNLFLRNELPIFGGHCLSDFEDKLPILQASFVFWVNTLPTYVDVLQWYIDINAGGIAHTHEEIERVQAMLREEQAKVGS